MSKMGIPSSIGYTLPQPVHRSEAASTAARRALHAGQTIRSSGAGVSSKEIDMATVYPPVASSSITIEAAHFEFVTGAFPVICR
jgi:hypothetical protein